jgi:hypothetical protein
MASNSDTLSLLDPLDPLDPLHRLKPLDPLDLLDPHESGPGYNRYNSLAMTL